MKTSYVDKILSHQAAAILGCTPANVRLLERSGRLQAVRVGNIRIFDRREVERLHEERVRRAQATSRKVRG